MTQPVLTDAEMHILISGNLLPVGLSLDRLESFARNVEQSVLKKLAEQEPVAWTAKAMLGEHYFNGELGIEAFCSKEVLLHEYSAAESLPLYTHPCILEGSDHIPDTSKMVPEGWQLVPIEATEEMQDAACLTNGTTGDRYKAMLAAAPKYTESKK